MARQQSTTDPSPPGNLRLRIIVRAPLSGVRMAVQTGKSGLLAPTRTDDGQLEFELSLRLGTPLPDGSPNFLGEFAQGPPRERFVYVNSGAQAGQTGSPWSRRAKLPLALIPRPMVDAALASGTAIVEAHMPGTMADGGPVCATVKPHTIAWQLRHVIG